MSCSKTESVEPFVKGEKSLQELESGLVDFQWRLFQQTLREAGDQKNILISPLSVASALYMALEGAADDTKEDLMEGLGLSYGEGESVTQAYQELMDRLHQVTGAFDLTSVNGVFYDQNRVIINDTFMHKMRNAFQAEDFVLDFDETASVAKINDWVTDKTNDRIKKIIEEIKEDDIMFLINALFLQADWSNPFALEQSYQDTFRSADGTSALATFMTQDVNDNRSYQDEEILMVEKALADTNYSMVFLQPSSDQDLSRLVESFHADDFTAILDQMRQGRILLHLPKFESTFELEMSGVLKAMGMESAFSPAQANFSKLGTAGGNIFLSRVQHKAFLSVDEKGVEGAAVTSVAVSVTSLPPTFKFNRPFVYLIRNRLTDAYLFVGTIQAL